MPRWVEHISFSETRNYVQRVLENAFVYDLMNPVVAAVCRAACPISSADGAVR